MEQYIKGLIPQSQGSLKEMEDYAKLNNVPIVQKETAKFIELMVNNKKPQRILELGTAIGYSAIMMAMAAGEECKITTIERDLNMILLSKNNIEKYGFANRIEVIQGECLDVLEKLNGEYDIIFIDAGKGHYNHFLPHCLRMLKKDGMIIADNVLFRGMVASRELLEKRKITIVKRMRSYLEMISNNDELITSVIPMGDGIAITTKRSKVI